MSNSLFSDYILPIILATIMFGMGSSLEFKDFKRVSKHSRQVLTGLAGQMLALPLIAFGIAALSPLPPVSKAGLVLIASCPGGTASNLITYLLKGAVALSVTLTALNSFLILFTVPLEVRLGLELFMGEKTRISLPFWRTMLNIFLTILLPILLGLLFRKWFRHTAESLQKVFRWLLPALLAAAFAGVMFIDKAQKGPALNLEQFLQLFPFALALNIVAMLLAYFVAKSVLKEAKAWYTISIETGLQNSGLALFVASSLLHNKQMALVAVVYGAFSFFSTAGVAWLLKKFSHRAAFSKS